MSAGFSVREPWSFRGRVEIHAFDSGLFRGHPSRARDRRETPVYIPRAAMQGQRCPVLFVLQSFTGRPHDFLETHPWRNGVVATLDAAIARGEVPPAFLVMPDGFTHFGGSQYVDSDYNGPHESHIVSELVPWIDGLYPTLAGRRAVVGHSSGGFGALHLAMRHPEVFTVAASISGDCCFEYCYGADMLACVRGLAPFGGDATQFMFEFGEKHSLEGDNHAVINMFAMSAAYSPNPKSPLGFDLPMDLRTGARIDAVWRRWLEFDPVLACERYAGNLKKLELLHVECGLRDEYHLQLSARILVDKLRALGIAVDHEEHPGSHRGLSQRYAAVLPKLIARLS